MINVFQPALQQEELEAVQEVFASNWIGKGPKTNQFEREFAGHLVVDPRLVRSITCCTEGLFQAIALLGLKAGDEVILPAISFVGAANAVASQGARPVFCDVDLRTLNPTGADIAEKITARTKALIVSHYGGVPCRMDEIVPLAAAHRIAVIEDCACAVASRFEGKACGTLGEIGVWSFDSMKILSTGDGGMLCCKTVEMAQCAEREINLGLLTRSGFSNQDSEKWWEFEVASAGRRAGMNDLTSAIGLAQLRKLAGFVARRRAISDCYTSVLGGLSWLRTPPPVPVNSESSYYFYYVQVPPALRDRLAVFLRNEGIYTTFRYYPLHRVSFYGAKDSLPDTEKAAASTLCIPLHPSLSDDDVAKVIEAVVRFGKAH